MLTSGDDLFRVIFVSVGMGTLGFAIYHGYMMIQNIRGDKQLLSNLIAPFVLLMPRLFTEKGNFHRKRFGAFMLIFLLWVGLGVGLKHLFVTS